MTIENTLAQCQRGLGHFTSHAKFCHYVLDAERRGDKAVYEQWLQLAQKTEERCLANKAPLVVLRGVDLTLWTQWNAYSGASLPVGFADARSTIAKPPFAETPGDLWFHIKSDSAADCDSLAAFIEEELGELIVERKVTDGSERHGGRVLGGRFADPMINPVDRNGIVNRVLVGDHDPQHRGAAYALSQKFVHDWVKLDAMSELSKENMIGRSETDVLLPIDTEDRHIRCVRQLGEGGVNLRILRQTLPYGDAPGARGKEVGVHFTAYGRSPEVFEALLRGIRGEREDLVKDRLFTATSSVEGHYWYIPTTSELGLTNSGDLDQPRLAPYFDVQSPNRYMHYNSKSMLHRIGRSPAVEQTPLSERIVALLERQFSRWHEGWYRRRWMPSPGHLKEYLADDEQFILEASAALRKGKAIQISLAHVLQGEAFRREAGLFTVSPLEIIVGNMPPLSLGSGSQVMEYLREDERIEAFFRTLDEYSSTGHNIPDYSMLLREGIGGVLSGARDRLAQCDAESDTRDFHQSVVWALEGLSAFFANYGALAAAQASALPPDDESGRAALTSLSERMTHLATEKPRTFHDGIQLIFGTNCALHQIGEPMSIGRLDQVLIPYYKADLDAGRLTPDEAQEILDAFWLKMDETVLLNRKHMNDYLNYGTGAVFYSGGNFPQGAATNQWVQQVTVGGTIADDSPEGRDACNELTLMCLRSAARLPLNAPCLSLRVHKQTPANVIHAASEALLSGGAHPVLLNDDKMIPALLASDTLALEDARDYACDGCYEAIIPGKTEWAFSYVPTLPVVGMAMNQGTKIRGAGHTHLRGMKTSWNSPLPEEITDFDQFIDIFFTHYRWLIQQFFNTLMGSYGDLWNVCPSPLFSAFVSDCAQRGRDMTNGGATYHIVAPMMCGITNTIDSLYAIEKMVFDDRSAVTTLPELLRCLQCSWGLNMQEPWANVVAGKERAAETAQRYATLRTIALALPKFGQGRSPEVVALAERVVEGCVAIIREGLAAPVPSVQKGYEQLKAKYGTEAAPFAFTLTPGVGTFEDNVGLGATMGASADGRSLGSPIAEDFAPAGWPVDLPVNHAPRDVFTGLADWNIPAIGYGISNAAPVDITIREEFPIETLDQVLSEFARGETGSNMMTVTCASPETFERATQFPEAYDLVRVRTGGWTEFFIALFPEHQQSMIRRPLFVAPAGHKNMKEITPLRAFKRVLIIMFENMYRSYVMQNRFMRGLAAKGIDMVNFHGVMHPSQTNYISSIAGELCNVSTDARPSPLLPQKTIVDLIERKQLSWKAYMDAYSPEATPWKRNLVPKDHFPYVIKHNPFSSFSNIVKNADRWKKIVSAHQLFEDAAKNQLPEYGWFTPDMWNDGHYTVGTQTDPHERAPALVDQQAIWLESLFGMLKFPGPDSVVPDGTLVVITYDEADFEADFDQGDKYTYDGPNQIYTVLLGSMVTPGIETEAYNHYSLIRTIEKNFDLGTLGKNDKHSNWFQFLWGHHFGWHAPQETRFVAHGPLAFACHRGVCTLVFRDGKGQLCAARYQNNFWTKTEVVGDAGDEPFALAVANDTLYLVLGSKDGIEQRTYDTSGWSPPSPVIACDSPRCLALAAFDEDQKLMLAWSDKTGRLSSLTQSDGTWDSESVGIGGAQQPFVTRGAVCLAVLGSSIFCIYEATHGDTLMVVSYNCADFNIITAGESEFSGPYNNTTKDLWSPSAFPVEQFATTPSPLTPGEPEPETVHFQGRAPLACATLDGVIHLAHGTPSGNQVVSETMSLSGLLTPRLPITYDSASQYAKTTSNGYGTLAQAGWTEQRPIEGTELGQQHALAMCRDGHQLRLVYAKPSGTIEVCVGTYEAV